MELGKHSANITDPVLEENNTQFGYVGRSPTEPMPPVYLGMRFQTELLKTIEVLLEIQEEMPRVPRRIKKMGSHTMDTKRPVHFPRYHYKDIRKTSVPSVVRLGHHPDSGCFLDVARQEGKKTLVL